MVAIVAGLLGGGATVELIRRLVPSRKEHVSLQTQFAEQVLARVNQLETQVATLHREVVQWRERYFEERETSSRLSGEVAQLRVEVAEGRERAQALQLEVDHLEARVIELTRRSA